MRHDVTEPIRIAGPVHCIFNLASPASPIDYARLPIETLRVGSLGTENGLRLAREKGAVFLTLLGWEPRVPLEEGLPETLAWFRKVLEVRAPAPRSGLSASAAV